MKPGNIKRANKDAKIYVGRSTTVHNLLFCVHTKTFLLVSSSVSSKQLLCFVHGQGQKSEQKHRIKNFVEFHNHSPLLTMVRLNRNENTKDTGHLPVFVRLPVHCPKPSYWAYSFEPLQLTV